MDTDWCEILHAVNHPVAYCEYGRNEAITASKFHERITLKNKLQVIPHGVDTTVYHPMPEERARRSEMFKDAKGKSMIGDKDFLIMNVNAHQRRKGLIQTLEIFKALQEWHLGDGSQPTNEGGEITGIGWPGGSGKVHLYMHMRRKNNDEQCDLQDAARQLGNCWNLSAVALRRTADIPTLQKLEGSWTS